MDDGNRETATNGKASNYLSWLDGKLEKKQVLVVFGIYNDPVFVLNVYIFRN